MIHCIQEVFVAQHSVDFRKRAYGLLGECYKMQLDPYKGHCVVFVHKRQHILRALVGDTYGLFLVERRFDGGSVQLIEKFMSKEAFVEVSREELSLLFVGARYFVKSKASKKR